MKTILLILIMLLAPALADPRDGSNGVPFLPPDPSLKTTDSFYRGTGCQYVGPEPAPAYVLPPIFGGPVVEPQENESWMDLSEHNEKISIETKTLTAKSSYELTENQMQRANLTLGSEGWL
ncbi:MAG: hypothetical protein WC455_24430 [Dehalococcoidia bacterium]|jgi:hypothetical protein